MEWIRALFLKELMAATPQQIIDAIDNFFLAVANGTKVESYEIGGRQIKNYPVSDLLKMRDAAEILLSKANNSGVGRGYKTRTRFER